MKNHEDKKEPKRKYVHYPDGSGSIYEGPFEHTPSYQVLGKRRKPKGLYKILGKVFIILVFFTPVIVYFTKNWWYFLLEGVALLAYWLSEKIPEEDRYRYYDD